MDSEQPDTGTDAGQLTAPAAAAAAAPPPAMAAPNLPPLAAVHTAATGPMSPADLPSPGPKRPQKTPIQMEVLELSFKIDPMPSEPHRRAIGERIGLTEKEVQAWFTNRRRKEKRRQQHNQALDGLPEGIDPALAAAAAAAAAARSPPGAPASTTAAAAGTEAAAAAGGGGPTTGLPPAQPRPRLAISHLQVASAAGQPPTGGTPTGRAGLASGGAPSTQPTVTPGSSAGSPAAGMKAVARRAEAPSQSVTPAGALRSPYTPGTTDMDDEEDSSEEEEAPPQTYQQMMEMQQLLAMAKTLLGFPFRQDGPPLAFEFDAPPDPNAPAQGAKKRKRIMGGAWTAEADEEGLIGLKRSKPVGPGLPRPGMAAADYDLHLQHLAAYSQAAAARQAQIMQDKESRAKLKEQMRVQRDMAKLAALQDKEMRKLQAVQDKLARAEERKKMVEERRKEKEHAKLLAAQERQVIRQRQREGGAGPPEDLELELEDRLARARAAWYTSAAVQQAAVGGAPPDVALLCRLPADQQEIMLAQWMPPPAPWPPVELQPAVPPGLDQQVVDDVLSTWGLIVGFPTLLGLPPITVEQLLESLVQGQGSALLGAVHMQLLRLVQLDMEEAYHSGVLTAGGNVNFSDRAVLTAAQRLVESWAWGLDVDVWRAHLNLQTWPEVLRQVALACGAGGKRSRARTQVTGKIGIEGEDVIEAAPEEGRLRLQLPTRFALGTMKEAAWRVLSEVDHNGMDIKVVARLIQQRGLRDLSTSKTPEASVAGALSRDVIFTRVKPATYALTSIINHHKRMVAAAAAKGQAAANGAGPQQQQAAAAAEGAAGAAVKAEPEAAGQPAQAVKQEGGAPTAAADGATPAANGDLKQEVGAGPVAGAEAAPADAAAAAAPAADQPPAATVPAVKADPDAAAHGQAAGLTSSSSPVPHAANGNGAAGPASSGVEVVERTPADGAEGPGGAQEHDEEDGSDEEGDRDSDEEAEGRVGAPGAVRWAALLLTHDYDVLPLRERVGALRWLCDQVVEGPGLRNELREREERVAVLRKQLWEESQADKRRRQQQEADKAAQLALQAQDDLVRAYQRQDLFSPEALAALRETATSAQAAAVAASAAVGKGLDLTHPADRPAHHLQEEDQQQQQLQQHQQQQAAGASRGPTPPAALAAAAGGGGAAAAGTAAGGAAAAADGPTPPPGAAAAAADGRATPTAEAAGKEGGQPGSATPAAQEPEDPAADLARRQQRMASVRRVEDANATRLEPLGFDRHYNRYWLISTAAGGTEGLPGDPGSARLWVEAADSGSMQLVTTVEQLDAIIDGLLTKGQREGGLYQALLGAEDALKAAMPGTTVEMPAGWEQVVALPDHPHTHHHHHHRNQHAAGSSSSPSPGQLADSSSQQQQPVGVLLAEPGSAPAAAKRWLLRGPLYVEVATAAASASSSQPANLVAPVQQELAAAATTGSSSLAEAALKLQLLRVHSAVAPRISCAGHSSEAWVASVKAAEGLVQLRGCLAQLEVALSNTPGLLSKEWAPCPVLVKGAWLSSSKEVDTAIHEVGEAAGEERRPGDDRKAAAAAAAAAETSARGPRPTADRGQVLEPGEAGEHLAWLPATFAALTLRLATLDAAIVYQEGGRAAREMVAPYRYAVRPLPLVFPPSVAEVLRSGATGDASAAANHSSSSSSSPAQMAALLRQLLCAQEEGLGGPAAGGPWLPLLHCCYMGQLERGADKPGRWQKAPLIWPPFPDQVFVRGPPQDLALPRDTLAAAVADAKAAGTFRTKPHQLRSRRGAAGGASATSSAAAGGAQGAPDSGTEATERATPPPGAAAGGGGGGAGAESAGGQESDTSRAAGGGRTKRPARGGAAAAAAAAGGGGGGEGRGARTGLAALPPRGRRGGRGAARAARAAAAVVMPIVNVLSAGGDGSSTAAAAAAPLRREVLRPLVQLRRSASPGIQQEAAGAVAEGSGSSSSDEEMEEAGASAAVPAAAAAAAAAGWGFPGSGWSGRMQRHQVVRVASMPVVQQQEEEEEEEEAMEE